MQIRLLRPEDIPQAMLLKEAAGWNQTEEDWRRLLRLQPDGCFGLECDGRLAATTTALIYDERLAWIGMVLTLPEFRGRGFARRLMEHALSYLEAAGIHWIKLDATDMGAPLYRSLGFETESVIERWAGIPPESARASVSPYRPLQDLDERAFGADRSALLADLAQTAAACIGDQAFAMGRPGSNAPYFGPCVSKDEESVLRLMNWFRGLYPGQCLFWDVSLENQAALDLARRLGFRPVRRVERMARAGVPGAPPIQTDTGSVFAMAGFEYG